MTTFDDRRRLRRVSAGTLVGTAFEWYGYNVYGLMAALVFNKLFFPSFDPVVGTLLAFLSFGVGFLARPIGAVLFGHLGDRVGRRTALLWALILMGFASASIGLIPSYAVIGIWAPIILVTLRVLEGISLGGEWAGAVTLAVEHAPDGKKGVYGSVPQLGAPIGNIVAPAMVALVTLLPDEQFMSWGWRIPFLFSFLFLGVAVYIRLRMEESPEFVKVVKERRVVKVPLFDALKTNWRRVLLGIGAALVASAPPYLLSTYIINYGTTSIGIGRLAMLVASLLGAVVFGVFVVIAGRLGDRYAPWKIVAYGNVALGAMAFPVMALLHAGSTLSVMLAVIVGYGLIGLPYGALATTLVQLFTDRSRYTSLGVTYNLAGAVGGFAPALAVTLSARLGNDITVLGTLLVVAAAISTIGGFLAGRAAANDRQSAAKELVGAPL